uniref:Uncharacterized protein n=1 Tax=Timema bartmani TaxID=61472 RepID=A0A7R9EZF7_9NEOP|nr:unnamed protein product [Timema bartmani]
MFSVRVNTDLQQQPCSSQTCDQPMETMHNSHYIPSEENCAIVVVEMQPCSSSQNLLKCFAGLLPTGKVVTEEEKEAFLNVSDAYKNDIEGCSRNALLAELELWYELLRSESSVESHLSRDINSTLLKDSHYNQPSNIQLEDLENYLSPINEKVEGRNEEKGFQLPLRLVMYFWISYAPDSELI